MTKEQVKTVRYAHKVRHNDNIYIAIEYGRDLADGEPLRCVLQENWKRWKRLYAWSINGVMEQQESKETLLAEKKGYEVLLPVSETQSAETVAIVDGMWNTLFFIDNFGRILINGEEREVVFFDEWHFEVRKVGSGSGTMYHCNEFGEMVKRHNAIVKPAPAYVAGLVDEFYRGFDFYNYSDEIEDAEQNILAIKEQFEKGEVEHYLSDLSDITSESEGTVEDQRQAERLLLMIRAFKKQEKEVVA